MRPSLTAILACAFVTAECSDNRDSNSETSPAPQDTTTTDVASFPLWRWWVSPQPSDLSTDISPSPIGIVVRSRLGDEKPPDSVLDEIATLVSVLDAQGVPVALNVRGVRPEIKDPDPNADPPLDDFEILAHVEVTPKEPWKSEWHSLILNELPAMARASGFRARVDANDGPQYAVRFAPNSLPTYQAFELCNPGAKPMSISIMTSQPLSGAEAPYDALSVTADDVACNVSAGAEGSRTLDVRCGGAANIGKVVIAVTRPMLSLDQKTVRLFDGRETFEMTWPSQAWVETQPGCWAWAQ